MDVPGPCAFCHRPAILATCGLCGKLHCVDHASPERHACVAGRGPRRPPAPGDLFTE